MNPSPSERSTAAIPTPLSGRQILAAGETTYRRGFVKLVALAAAIYLPVVMLAFAVMNEMIPLGAGVVDGKIVVGSPAALDRLQLIMLAPILLTAVALVVTTAALHFALADQYLTDRCDLREAIRLSLRRVLPVLGLFLLTLMAVAIPWVGLIGYGRVSGVLGLTAFIALPLVTWVIAMVGFFAVPTLMRENVGPIEALARSWKLLAGSWTRLTGLLLVTFLGVGVLWGIVGKLLESALVAGAETPGRLILGLFVSDAVPTVLLSPLIAAIVTVAYFDLRARRGEAEAQATEDTRPVAADLGADPLGPLAPSPPAAVPAVASPATSAAAPAAAIAPPLPSPAGPRARPAAPAPAAPAAGRGPAPHRAPSPPARATAPPPRPPAGRPTPPPASRPAPPVARPPAPGPRPPAAPLAPAPSQQRPAAPSRPAGPPTGPPRPPSPPAHARPAGPPPPGRPAPAPARPTQARPAGPPPSRPVARPAGAPPVRPSAPPPDHAASGAQRPAPPRQPAPAPPVAPGQRPG